jgi:PIN domain nuclease of toxin-antitoxin system
VRLLLDTHVAIWAVSQPNLIPAHVRSEILSTSNEVFVSAITILEISIKHRLRRHDAPPFGGSEAISAFTDADFQFLHVTPRHAAEVELLDRHHEDPFDHLLLAQARVEPMQMVSKDSRFPLYDCPLINW